MSAVNISGYIQVMNGPTLSNKNWRHGIIPLPDGATQIEFNNLRGERYSSSVLNYFVDSNGVGIPDTQFKGNAILGAGVVIKDIPMGAKGLLLNAGTDNLPDYNIYIYVNGIISRVLDLEDKVKELEKEDSTQIKLICPDIYYAVVGEEFNLYYDGIVNSMDAGLQSPKNIYIDIQCPDLQNASNQVGVRRERMWQITASKLTEQYIGEHDIQITAYREYGEMIDRKIVKLKIVSNAPLSSQKYILCIGDSLTNNGPIVSTCGNHFQSIGGTQPIFIGQRITDGYKHEGYPGYTFGSFVTNASKYAYVIFDVPRGISVSVNDKYKTKDSIYTIRDIRIEGLDNKLRLRCERSSGSTEPDPTGILTKITGSSSSARSIEYSAYERESGNPFWNLETNCVDFTKYREKMGMGANKFDIVFIMLGTNDSIGDEKQMNGSLINAKTLINAILEDADSYPTKILLQMVPADANTISSWQVYSDILGSGRKIGYWKNYWSLRKLLYEEFTKSEWENKVILGQAPLGVDRYYGYPYSEVISSQRIQINEVYHTNSVHPNADGYKQFGDGYYLQAKANL